jgi:hypothetical protein
MSEADRERAKNNLAQGVCPRCHGKGVLARYVRTWDGGYRTDATCFKCDGTGEVRRQPRAAAPSAPPPPPTALLTVDTVALGQRVLRNPAHWRAGKWKDDRKQPGTVVGYTGTDGALVGVNSGSPHVYERISEASGAGWAVVLWDATRTMSVYPIGASGPLGDWWTQRGGGPCHSLLRLVDA